MKLPKTRNTYCPTCKKHSEHRVLQAKRKTPNSAHPMSYGGKMRAKLRGRRGAGNQGRYSKPPVSKWTMAGRKTSKKVDLRFECVKCKKQHIAGNSWRAKKVEFKQ
ncbi:MAG: 50S ribosomal protein L44e [Nanoarchaeota archaeon]